MNSSRPFLVRAALSSYKSLRSLHHPSRRRPIHTQTLERIKQIFPDKAGLHDRIDTLLRSSTASASTSTGGADVAATTTTTTAAASANALPLHRSRIAIIPLGCRREDITTVLDSILLDPLAADQQWFKIFQHRLVSKDILVRYSPTFDFVGTYNSLVEYPIPFRVPTAVDPDQIEFLEANSIADSWDHLKSCYLHIYVAKAEGEAIPNTDFPHVLVIDRSVTDLGAADSGLAAPPTPSSPSPSSFSSRPPSPPLLPAVVESNSSRALDAGLELRDSRARAGECVDKWERNIGQVERILFQSKKSLTTGLLQSVVRTCQSLLPSPDLADKVQHGAKEIQVARQKWSQNAHRELQTDVSNGFDQLDKDLAWWKLYYCVDDVYDIVCKQLSGWFLPKAKNSYLYYMGRIDIQAEQDYGASTVVAGDDTPAAGGCPIVSSQESLLSGPAVDLHNQALSILTKNLFFVQLPFLFIPLLGTYFYGYSLYAMGSLVGLGLAVGCTRIQKQWIKAISQFRETVNEEAREAITESEIRLWENYEEKVIEQQKLVSEKEKLIHQLKNDSV